MLISVVVSVLKAVLVNILVSMLIVENVGVLVDLIVLLPNQCLLNLLFSLSLL